MARLRCTAVVPKVKTDTVPPKDPKLRKKFYEQKVHTHEGDVSQRSKTQKEVL